MTIRNLNNKILPVLFCIFLFGCNGVFNCPIDPPSCCDNLFGCDPFQLPEGCDCDRYGLISQSKNLTTKTAVLKRKSPGFMGKWQGQLNRTSTTCSQSFYRVDGNAHISGSGKKVKINIPGYGRLEGDLFGKRINAKGGYKVGSCSAELRTSLINTRVGVAKTRVSFDYLCDGKKQCESEYNGIIYKK